MWFSVTLWTLLFTLLCSSFASSSASLHSSRLYPDYDRTESRGDSDYDKDFSPSWTADTLARQILDGKTSDALLSSSLEGEDVGEGEKKEKRESHSLSIVNPLDVLRQRLMLEMARRRMKENQDQIRENALILKNLGRKRTADRRRRVSNSDDFEV